MGLGDYWGAVQLGPVACIWCVHGAWAKALQFATSRGNECRDAGVHSEHGWQEGADAARCAHGTLVVALVVHGLVHV